MIFFENFKLFCLSPDSSVLDFYYWTAMKEQVSAKVRTREITTRVQLVEFLQNFENLHNMEECNKAILSTSNRLKDCKIKKNQKNLNFKNSNLKIEKKYFIKKRLFTRFMALHLKRSARRRGVNLAKSQSTYWMCLILVIVTTWPTPLHPLKDGVEAELRVAVAVAVIAPDVVGVVVHLSDKMPQVRVFFCSKLLSSRP